MSASSHLVVEADPPRQSSEPSGRQRLTGRGPAGRRRHRSPSAGGYLFLAPAVVFLLVFAIYPIAVTVVYSFRNVTVAGLLSGRLPFVGLGNYREVLADPQFVHSVTVSVIFTVVSVIFQFGIGFALALLFNVRFPGRGAMRAIVMIGWVLPLVVVGTIFKWMFQSGEGVVNTVLTAVHPSLAVAWLEEPKSALGAIILTNIWLGIPFDMAMLLAGLQAISPVIYEAARIDGAGRWQCLRYVTLPLMRGPSLIVATLGVIYTMNVFEIILIVTGGGPGDATTVVPYYAYQRVFQFFKVGQASAVTVLMLCLLALVSALYLRLLRRSER
jgi:multiple sugar transport system permease protein